MEQQQFDLDIVNLNYVVDNSTISTCIAYSKFIQVMVNIYSKTFKFFKDKTKSASYFLDNA